MKAVQIDRFGGPEVLHVREVPDPRPGPGEVLVRFAASTINPVDVKVRSGAERSARHPLPLTLGWDLAGQVVAIGTGAGRFDVGQDVVAMSAMAATGRGTWAELVALPEHLMAPAPRSVSLVDAAGLPLAGLAAAQAVDVLDPQPGHVVVVTGATGAVGGIAVQLLALRGVTVHAAVRDLARADEAARLGAAVTYADRVPGFVADGLLDTAGTALPHAVRAGGRYVSVVPGTLPAHGDLAAGVEIAMSYVDENGHRLAELVQLVDAGRLRLRTAAAYRLVDVVAAHTDPHPRGVSGKTALTAG